MQLGQPMRELGQGIGADDLREHHGVVVTVERLVDARLDLVNLEDFVDPFDLRFRPLNEGVLGHQDQALDVGLDRESEPLR